MIESLLEILIFVVVIAEVETVEKWDIARSVRVSLSQRAGEKWKRSVDKCGSVSVGLNSSTESPWFIHNRALHFGKAVPACPQVAHG